MCVSMSSSVIFASILACFGTLGPVAAIATTNGAPSKVLDTRDPPGETLKPDFKWLRTVQEPYFHYYLQTDPQLVAGPGIVGDPTTAAQWAIQDGQLVELVDTNGTLLHMHVEEPTDDTTVMLGVTIAAEPNSFGTFAWSGKMSCEKVVILETPCMLTKHRRLPDVVRTQHRPTQRGCVVDMRRRFGVCQLGTIWVQYS